MTHSDKNRHGSVCVIGLMVMIGAMVWLSSAPRIHRGTRRRTTHRAARAAGASRR